MTPNIEYDIRGALMTHLTSMAGVLPTVLQNNDPPDGMDATKPYQKAFVMNVPPAALGLQEKTARYVGILQVSLCYPAGSGTRAVEQYASLLAQHFAAGTKLQQGGVKVRIRGRASVADPISTAPYVVPVSIRFESIN